VALIDSGDAARVDGCGLGGSGGRMRCCVDERNVGLILFLTSQEEYFCTFCCFWESLENLKRLILWGEREYKGIHKQNVALCT
jgi:hypothetical protein